MDSSTLVFGLASIPSLCYLHLSSFEMQGVERHAIVVCCRIPARTDQPVDSTSETLRITAYGLCSLLYHNPDHYEHVSELEAIKAIKEGARISTKRLWGGQELDFLLQAASTAFERLRAARLMEIRRIQAARSIQRAWIPIANDPRREFKKRRLLLEFDLLVQETEQLMLKRI